MTFLEHLEHLREAKKEELGQDEYFNTPFDAKKVADALQDPIKRKGLNKREMESYEGFRDIFTEQVLTGTKVKEFTEDEAEVFKHLGFKVGGKKEDDGYTIYTTYSK